MKAKLYVHEDKLELLLTDGALFIPKKNEKKEAFLQRIQKVVTDEYLDDEFELVEITKETVATNDDDTLLGAAEKATGLQKKLIEAVLADRGIIKQAKTREKVEKQSAEVMKATPHYKECEEQIDKYVSFSPFKKTEVIEGQIRGVALNKTNTRVYYTVVDENNKRYCCAALNETIKFIDAPEKEEKKAKPAAADAKTEKTKPAAAAKAGAKTEAAAVAPEEDLS